MPLDFNGDLIAIGDHVMWAKGRGVLAEGVIHKIGVDGHQDAVVIQSLIAEDRQAIVDGVGCIKVLE